MNHSQLSQVLLRFVTVLSLSGCIHTPPFHDGSGQITPGSIAVMETVSIGGIPQQVWFRGINTHNPALLILHGGPGVRALRSSPSIRGSGEIQYTHDRGGASNGSGIQNPCYKITGSTVIRPGSFLIRSLRDLIVGYWL
jgi:hypothetical protein